MPSAFFFVLFLLETNLSFFRKVFVCPKPLFSVIFDDHVYVRTPNRRGTQSHAEKLPNFALNSHLDPIGDQNDVQKLGVGEHLQVL